MSQSDRMKPQLIIALDVDTLEQARELIDKLSPEVEIFKVGSQLFTACGPAAVRFIMARGKKVFLDLKYHDIPNTVANAVGAAVSLGVPVGTVPKGGLSPSTSVPPGLFMYTMHTLGGLEMLKSAVAVGTKKAQEFGFEKPLALGITVLTSEAKKDDIAAIVLERALLAQAAGCDGVVAAVEEVEILRQKLGKDFIIVTPGIRPAGEKQDDQKRISTPAEAVKRGSNFLVVGRPVLEAANPLAAAQKILEEIAGMKDSVSRTKQEKIL